MSHLESFTSLSRVAHLRKLQRVNFKKNVVALHQGRTVSLPVGTYLYGSEQRERETNNVLILLELDNESHT